MIIITAELVKNDDSFSSTNLIARNRRFYEYFSYYSIMKSNLHIDEETFETFTDTVGPLFLALQ